MKWGESLRFLEDLAAEGQHVQALEDRPDLSQHLRLVWSAFWDLQGDRAISPSGLPRPIPFSAARLWAAGHDYAGDAFDWLWSRLQGLDRAYLSAEADRMKRYEPSPSQGF